MSSEPTALRGLYPLKNPSSSRSAASPRAPQERAERTRLAILEAALRLIARRGVGATRFRDVADAAHVSLGVVTYHFPKRRDLLSAAFAFHLEQTDRQGRSFSDAYGKALRERALPTDEATDAVIALLRSFVEDERDSFIASHELTLELTRDEDLARRVRAALDTHRSVVERMVASAGSEDAQLDAEILSAAFEGLALKWLVHRGDAVFEERLRRVVARLLSKFEQHT
jgi:AcrR family transcriptional regulator